MTDTHFTQGDTMFKKILIALATGAATVFLGNAVYRKVKHV